MNAVRVLIGAIRTATMPLVLMHVAVILVINLVRMESLATVLLTTMYIYFSLYGYNDCWFLQTLMNVLKELTNVTNSATIQLAAILATVLNLAIDSIVMKQLVKVCILRPHVIHVTYYTRHADIDECTEGADDCAQTCTDTDGNYTCSCSVGYMLANDQHGCDGQNKYIMNFMYSQGQSNNIFTYVHPDINECQENIHSCNQICLNVNGSYLCSCYPGYRLDSDGQNCTRKCMVKLLLKLQGGGIGVTYYCALAQHIIHIHWVKVWNRWVGTLDMFSTTCGTYCSLKMFHY